LDNFNLLHHRNCDLSGKFRGFNHFDHV
jgi:hypothetical protein